MHLKSAFGTSFMRLCPFFRDILSVFFPKVCLGCSCVLIAQENIICVACRHSMPFTNFHKDPDNAVMQLLAGHCKIEYATALLYFEKKSLVQTLLHSMKYRNHPELGILFGQWMGEALKTLKNQHFDAVVPVPVSKKRLKKRGYNQVALFSEHIAKALNIPSEHQVLVKILDVDSLVFKDKKDRDILSQDVFYINNYALAGKHVLLVDDLITTGKTLEVCTNALHRIPNLKLSVATIAMAI